MYVCEWTPEFKYTFYFCYQKNYKNTSKYIKLQQYYILPVDDVHKIKHVYAYRALLRALIQPLYNHFYNCHIMDLCMFACVCVHMCRWACVCVHV